MTVNAPVERVGVERERVMRQLYAHRARHIHLAETQMQMKFDKNLDAHRPAYWPSFPLRLNM